MRTPAPGGDGASQLTKLEVEVARILDQLPKLVQESPCRRLPITLHWGASRKRSVPPDSPPPSPNIGDGEQSNKGGAASSPPAPLPFTPGGGEKAPTATAIIDTKVKPGPGRPSPFKNAKQHKEWVKEQSQTLGSLSVLLANLERSLEEAKGRHRTLKARNSWLREMRCKILSAMGDQQQQQPYEQSSSEHVPAGPTQPVGHHQWRQATEPAFSIGRVLEEPRATGSPQHEIGSPPSSAAAVGGSRVIPDLNVSAEEVMGLMLGMGIRMGLQQSAYKAAMTAPATRRRPEIQWEKNSSAASPRICKIPRLR